MKEAQSRHKRNLTPKERLERHKIYLLNNSKDQNKAY